MGGDRGHGRARDLTQRGATVAQYPRVAVAIDAEGADHIQRGERVAQHLHGVRVVGILNVMVDAREAGLRPRVLDLQPRHE